MSKVVTFPSDELTPSQVVADLMERAQNGTIKNMVVLWIDDDGEMNVSVSSQTWSEVSYKHFGLIDYVLKKGDT